MTTNEFPFGANPANKPRVKRIPVVSLGVGLACLLSLRAAAAAQVANVSTMAQLRTAIGNASITTININPGTYLLTSSGSGQLSITRNLTITNTGGDAW